jgi:hypothetical protein
VDDQHGTKRTLGPPDGGGEGPVRPVDAVSALHAEPGPARLPLSLLLGGRFILEAEAASGYRAPGPERTNPMLQSHVIDIDGAFVGAAVRLDNGYRFIATDLKLDDLDGSIWPTLADIQRLARRLYFGSRLTQPLAH